MYALPLLSGYRCRVDRVNAALGEFMAWTCIISLLRLMYALSFLSGYRCRDDRVNAALGEFVRWDGSGHQQLTVQRFITTHGSRYYRFKDA